MKKFHSIIGIDEAGRGPLAGPVAVGVLVIPIKHKSHVSKIFREIKGKDSKKLSTSQREKWFKEIKNAKDNNWLDYKVSFVSASIIDKKGIEHAIRTCVVHGLSSLIKKPKMVKVKLDGRLKAPEEFIYQETIIKGDEKEMVISLASIVAKVLRDKKMVNFAKKYPAYGFERHKGYGTKMHYRSIKKYGCSEIHRKSFIH